MGMKEKSSKRKKRCEPSRVTLARLWMHSGNLCAFAGCSKIILDNDHEILKGRVAHIEAASEGGPRYNPDQTDEERCGYDNLMVLCNDHHDIVDKSKTTTFSVENLQEMKKKHEDRVKTQGYAVQHLPEELLIKLLEPIELLSTREREVHKRLEPLEINGTFRTQSPDNLLPFALKCAKEEDFQSSNQALLTLLLKMSDTGMLWVKLSENYIVCRDYDNALWAIDHVLSLNPNSIELVKMKANILFLKRDFLKAGDFLHASIMRYGDDPELQSLLGNVMVMMHHTQDGTSKMAEEYEKITTYETPEKRIGKVTYLLLRNRVPEAVKIIEEYEGDISKDLELAILYSVALFRVNRFSDALAMIEKLPKDYIIPVHQGLYGCLLFETGNKTDGLRYYHQHVDVILASWHVPKEKKSRLLESLANLYQWADRISDAKEIRERARKYLE